MLYFFALLISRAQAESKSEFSHDADAVCTDEDDDVAYSDADIGKLEKDASRIETQSSQFQFTAALDSMLVSMCRQWNLQSDSHFIESLLSSVEFEHYVAARKEMWLNGSSMPVSTLNSAGLEHYDSEFADSLVPSATSMQPSHLPVPDVWSSISAKIGCSPTSARLRFLWLARDSFRNDFDHNVLVSNNASPTLPLSAGLQVLNLHAHPRRLAILNILVMALNDTADSASPMQTDERSEQVGSDGNTYPTAFPSLDATLRRSRAAHAALRSHSDQEVCDSGVFSTC